MQSNFGIVTKMGVWLMPWPQTYLPFWVRAWRDDDLAAIVDTLRRLSLDGTIRMVPQIGNTLIFASFLSRRSQWWDGDGPIPEPVIEKIARELEVGRWMMRAALYGDEAVVDHRYAKVKAAFEAIPGVEVWGTKTTPAQAPGLPHPAERTQAGVPDLEMNFMTGWYGGEVSGGHVGFSPVAPMTGGHALAVRDLLRGLIEEEAKLDYLGALLAINARSFIHVTMVLFDTANEAQVRGAYDTCKLLVREAAAHGYGEYRAHLDFMDLAVRAVQLRRPRPAALQRADQGRARPERHPLAGQAGDLAAGDARRGARRLMPHTFQRPAERHLHAERTAVRGPARSAEPQELAEYRVLGDGGWFEARKCQRCLESVSREPAPPFGSYVPLGLQIARTIRCGPPRTVA